MRKLVVLVTQEGLGRWTQQTGSSAWKCSTDSSIRSKAKPSGRLTGKTIAGADEYAISFENL